MQAIIVRVALHLTATPKGGKKTYIYFCKSTDAKSNVISYLSLMDQSRRRDKGLLRYRINMPSKQSSDQSTP